MSEVRASHLLVKHQGSRRPASWRDPDGAVITKRSKAAALDELEAYREQIESGAVTLPTSPPRCRTVPARSTAATSGSSVLERCRRRSR